LGPERRVSGLLAEARAQVRWNPLSECESSLFLAAYISNEILERRGIDPLVNGFSGARII
jgi:hypothetical protein